MRRAGIHRRIGISRCGQTYFDAGVFPQYYARFIMSTRENRLYDLISGGALIEWKGGDANRRGRRIPRFVIGRGGECSGKSVRYFTARIIFEKAAMD